MKTTVLLESDWSTQESDWSAATRIFARTLEFSGFSVGLASSATTPAASHDYQEVAHLLQRPGHCNSYIYGMPYYEQTFAQALKLISKHSQVPSIVLTGINGLSISALSANAINSIEGACVFSQADMNTLISSGVHRDKVFHIPLAFFPNDPYLGLSDLARKRGPLRFYSVGTWEPRKGLDRLVQAFLHAFKPGEAHLTLKLVGFPWANFLSPELLAVDEMSKDFNLRAKGWTFESWQANVTILRNPLTPEEMLGLHANNDVYVSCALSESVDLNAFRAKLAGKRIIATPSGFVQDLVGPEDVQVSASSEMKASSPYDALRWHNYEISSLISALLEAVQPSRAKQIWSRDSFRVATVSRKLTRMLEKVLGS